MTHATIHRRPRQILDRPRALLIARSLIALAALTIVEMTRAAVGIAEWTSSGSLGAGVNAVALNPGNPDTVFAGTAGKGVFKSTDGGLTWRSVSAGMGEIYIESVVVHPLITTFVYATSPNYGVFRSIDGGESWTAVNAGLPTPSAHHLAIGALPSIVYVTTNDGLFVSYDGGIDWMATTLRTGGDDGSGDDLALTSWIDCLATDSTATAVYACYFSWSNSAPSWQLLRSTDYGATWDAIPVETTGGPIAIAVDPAASSTLYVATYELLQLNSHVLRSRDAGETWEPVGGTMQGCEENCRVSALALDGREPCTVYAATDRGVFVAREGSARWRHPDTGMGGRWVANVAVTATDVTVVHAATAGGVFTLREALAACEGDLNGDDAVDVAELISFVRSTLDGGATIAQLIAAVDHALHGC